MLDVLPHRMAERGGSLLLHLWRNQRVHLHHKCNQPQEPAADRRSADEKVRQPPVFVHSWRHEGEERREKAREEEHGAAHQYRLQLSHGRKRGLVNRVCKRRKKTLPSACVFPKRFQT